MPSAVAGAASPINFARRNSWPDEYCCDACRASHLETQLAASGYFYPVGVNRGYVGLVGNPALLAAGAGALSDLQNSGKIAALARAAGLTYLPPREPAVLGDAMMKVLQQ